MPCGVVLRESLKHESVAATILYDQSRENERAAKIDEIDFDVRQSGEGVFWQFFPWIDGGAFEVSTDAFTTFRVRFLSQSARDYRLNSIGTSHKTQTARCSLSQHQLRSILPEIQQHSDTVQLLCHEKAIDQIIRGDPARQGQL